MGVHVIDYVVSFVILLGLLTFTITSATGTLDNLFIYHQNLELNSVATNLLNTLLGSTGSPSNWAQSTDDPTSIGISWDIGERNYINPFVPMRMMDVTVKTMYETVAYNDLSVNNLSPWSGANIYFRTDDVVTYDQASQLLNSIEDYNWRVTYTPVYNIEVETSMPTAIPWYAGWGYRIPLTINHTKFSVPMLDYQLLVSVDQPSLKATARQDGGDILFTTSDKLTKIPHELDSYDPNTGMLTAWVKIPLISDVSDTTIYMYYGNPTAENQGSPGSVWTGYSSVFHMEDVPDSSHIADSSVNALTGVKSGDHEPAEIVNGVVSYAQKFDGSNDYISLSQATLSGGSEVYEMWLKSVKASTLQTILSSGFKDNSLGFLDLSRLPQTETSAGNDLMIDYAANAAWVQKAGAAGIDLTCLVSFKNNLYSGASDGRFYKWNGVDASASMPSLPSPEKFSSLAVFNSKLYAGTDGGGKLYEWDEGYSSWILRAPTLKIKSLVLFSDNKIYGGTDDGRLLRWNTGTNKWDIVAPASSETSINCLVVYNNLIYAGTSPGGKLYQWNSAGSGSWVLVASPPISNPFTDVTSLRIFDGKLYGGTNPGGYLVSWTSGLSWVVEKTTGQNSITAIVTRESGSTTSSDYNGNSGSWSNGGDAVSSNNVYASHQSTFVPATTNSPSTGIGQWSSENNAFANGGSAATSTNAGDVSTFSGYGFALPEGTSVSRVRVRLDAWSAGNNANQRDDMLLEVNDGTSWLPNSALYACPSSDSNSYYVDVTGWASWDSNKVNGIQVRVTHIQDGNSVDTGSLDWIPIEVTYTTTATHEFYNFNIIPQPTITKVEVGVEGYTPGERKTLSIRLLGWGHKLVGQPGDELTNQ